MYKSDVNDYIEIDVMHLLKKVFAKKFLIVFCIVIGIIVTYLYTALFSVPKYSVYMKLYVLNKNGETNLTIQDFQLGNYLVKDYKEIITSGDVVREVISKGDLDISEKNFKKKLDISMPVDTRVITVRYTDSDPDRAYQIINILQEEARAQIERITNTQGVELIETPQRPENPDPNNMLKKYLMVTLAILLLSSLLIVMRELLNDKINGPEDIEDNMHLPLLGILPYRKSKTLKRRGR